MRSDLPKLSTRQRPNIFLTIVGIYVVVLASAICLATVILTYAAGTASQSSNSGFGAFFASIAWFVVLIVAIPALYLAWSFLEKKRIELVQMIVGIIVLIITIPILSYGIAYATTQYGYLPILVAVAIHGAFMGILGLAKRYSIPNVEQGRALAYTCRFCSAKFFSSGELVDHEKQTGHLG